jgi:hypothetical protein
MTRPASSAYADASSGIMMMILASDDEARIIGICRCIIRHHDDDLSLGGINGLRVRL